MFQFTALPPEILLCILRYLPLPALGSLRQTSKQWNQHFIENEAYVYRNAAYLHSFTPTPEESLQDACAACGPTVEGVTSWYNLCRRRYILEANWMGRGSPWHQSLATDQDDVHRIKVDEGRGIVITTHQDGGVNVRDLETDEILWALPRTYVRELAHCEYGNGFLIFDRLGQGKEVWRLASEYDESMAPPDEMQQEISSIINKHISKTKGSFRPWAVFTAPEFTQAYRFVYPNLLAAGFEKAYVWDVLTCEIVQAVPDLQNLVAGTSLGRINYVELSPLHVIICGSRQLRLFDRTTGSLAFHIDYDMPSDPIHAIPFPPLLRTSSTSLHVAPLVAERKTIDLTEIPPFIAVHVSPDGRTIVALSMDSHLVIIKDILSVIKGQQKLLDPTSSVTLAFGNSSDNGSPEGIYLAFEYGRVGVITSSGIFAVTLDAAKHSIIDRDFAVQQQLADVHSDVPTARAIARSSFPHLRCCQVLPFQHRFLLSAVTCLQMTETKMLFTWSPRAMPDMSYHRELHATAHWAWFNPPHIATSVEYDHEWPPLPGSTGTAGAPAVVQMPGGPPIDDGDFDNELDAAWQVELNHELDGDLVAGAEEDWEGIEDELPALEDAAQDNVPAVVPHQFLFHRATNSTIIACINFTEHTHDV